MKTIHHRRRVTGDHTTGFELTQRDEDTYMLRTFGSWHGRTKSVPVYLTLTDLEGLFDAIGQALIVDNEAGLTELLEAM